MGQDGGVSTGPPEVSPREADVLAAIGERLSNAEIAAKLYISVRTVESHVSSLLRKFGAANRWELVDRARDMPVTIGLAGIPAGWTSFIGRDRERDVIRDAITGTRLVTLAGPGGVGKTRLAAVVAAHAASWFPSAVAFVDLVPVGDGFVAEAVAAALGVAEHPQQRLESVIAGRIGRGRALLILDNCEHLLAPVAGFAARLLSECPNVRVLATSRERLGIPGERLVTIEPLPAWDAVALFLDRAKQVDPGFDTDPAIIAGLCARLDGLPLAIELAAARASGLGAEGLTAAIDDHLRLLTGGRGPDRRHQSLRAVLEWSHGLLDDEARLLFRRLAVFAGSFDLAAVTAVTTGQRPAIADGLGRLADKSLVIHERPAGRWRLLDTIRAFAADRLDASGERDAIQDRHLRWAAATATQLETKLSRAPGDDWRSEFDATAGDLREALSTAQRRHGAVNAHQFARSLGRLAFARRFLQEATDHFRRAAELAPTATDAVQDLLSVADCTFVSTTSGPDTFQLQLAAAQRADPAQDSNARAIALARAVATAGRYQVVRHPGPEATSEQARRCLGEASATGDHNDPAMAAALAIASAWSASHDLTLAQTAVAAARTTGDPVLTSAALDAVSDSQRRAGRLRQAMKVTQQRLDLLPAMDHDDPRALAEIEDILITACTDALHTGDLPTALSVAGQLSADHLLGGGSYIAASMQVPALILSGDLEAGLRQATWMWDRWQQAGRSPSGWVIPAMAMAALAHQLRGDQDAQATWRTRVLQIVGATGPGRERMLAPLVFLDVRAAIHTRNTTAAATLVTHAFGDFPVAWAQPYARAAGAELAVVAELPDAAERLTAAASTADQNRWAAACLARAAGRLHHDPAELTAAADEWERIGARLERAYTLQLLADRAAEGRSELTTLGLPLPP